MKHVKVILALLAALGVLGALLWRFALAEQVEFARVATAYGAKKVCSCLHVAGRDLKSCAVDFTEDVGMVSFADTGEGASASVLGGRIEATARHTPGQGCALVPDG